MRVGDRSDSLPDYDPEKGERVILEGLFVPPDGAQAVSLLCPLRPVEATLTFRFDAPISEETAEALRSVHPVARTAWLEASELGVLPSEEYR